MELGSVEFMMSEQGMIEVAEMMNEMTMTKMTTMTTISTTSSFAVVFGSQMAFSICVVFGRENKSR